MEEGGRGVQERGREVEEGSREGKRVKRNNMQMLYGVSTI